MNGVRRMCTDRMRKILRVSAAIMLPTGLAIAQETSPALRFLANDKGEYAFDTGVLRGTLRQDAKPRGLSSVVHVPTGTRLDASLGICSHYRVFTTNHRYGTAAWDWPGTSKLLADGAVQTTWPEAADRPFEMSAVYRWKDPQTLDVETTVTAHKDRNTIVRPSALSNCAVTGDRQAMFNSVAASSSSCPFATPANSCQPKTACDRTTRDRCLMAPIDSIAFMFATAR